ncbi:TRAP-type mannitol/chloroaromatic compound transport system, small permease component [Marinobacter segnicrescens]|uniref:TRAP transporter small permease protein n=2 Tax=Marinobacteraceae TaxID=2887365 RepID=A0A1I0HLP3_9GAMM|nr:TRAP-type mannitol/chloroaromatic compound transport system, small permease component [Marinobacter segnicrescens]
MRGFLLVVDGVNEVVGRVFSWAVVLIMLITVYDVVMRFAFGQPSLWAFDVVKQLYALEFMILAGFGLVRNAHVSVDVFTARLSRRKQAAMEVVSYLVFFFPFMVMLIWKSYEFAARSWAYGETTWGVVALPVYPIKTVMVVASVLLLLQGIAKVFRELAVLAGREEAC